MSLIAAFAFLLPQAGLSEDEFKKLHEELRPCASDVWRTIPWRISITQARLLALKEDKPMYFFGPAGSVLGNT